MTDIWTTEKRSEVMSRILGGNTGPERKVRSLLHRLGYRFTVNGPRNKSLPGKPDIVLPARRTIILVHGCFWHGHDNCPDFRMPASRTAWWTAKIAGNKTRDARVENELRTLGWHVVTIWSCAVKTKSALSWLEARLPALLGPPTHQRGPVAYDAAAPLPLAMVAEEGLSTPTPPTGAKTIARG